ncbi:DUF4336 domain-containing protein [Rhodobacteraceae bacterium LMO-12]|nr:DUF4336 domain-containing protein [Rhodobacteraceae bacterium LMO-JJ12]
MTTGYEPLNTLKPVGPEIWIVDGPAIRFYGMPFSTRATVVRLANGDLWVHSPTHLTEDLRAEVAALGPVRHLIAPNWIHYAYVTAWQAAFPEAVAWAAPGVKKRADKKGMAITFDRDLGDEAESPWAREIEQMIVRGSRVHHEAVFFHGASRTLVLTDLIENFEAGNLPWWMRIFARMAGIVDPDGQMPRDMRATFSGHRQTLRAAVERMIGWQPEAVIVAHGRWYRENGVAELRRAFRFLW